MTTFGDTGLQFGMVTSGSAVLGGVLGFTVKKLIKIIAVLVGLELGLFLYLDLHSIIEVHWHTLVTALAAVSFDVGRVPSQLLARGTTVPFGASFVGGFLVGFKKA